MTITAFTNGEHSQLYVATVEVDGHRDGCLVSFTTQCSIIPERYLVCLSVLNETFALARRADALALHRLAEDQIELARRFGSTRGDEIDKFAGISWERGATGSPVLAGCAGYLEGTIQARFPLGDHWGFVLAPVAAEVGGGGGSLSIDAVDFEAGHPPHELLEG